jgi:hypothetical protein
VQSAGNVATWYLSSITDTHGLTISYRYTKDSGVVYPLKIDYAQEGGAPGYEVRFTLVTRPDPITSYKNGFTQTTAKRISQVDVYVGSTLRHSYILGYATGVNGVRSLLAGITDQSIDESGNPTTLPPTTFSYNGPLTWQSGTSSEGIWQNQYSQNDMYKYKVTDLNGDCINAVQSGDEYPGQVLPGLRTYADINGDWFPDYIQGTTDSSSCFWSQNKYDYYLYFNAKQDSGYGFTGPISTSTTTLPPLGLVSCTGAGWFGYVGGLWADVNGDGLIDVMQNNLNVVVLPHS